MLSAPINTASSGAQKIVSGRTGYQIVVFSWLMVAAGSMTVTWQDSAGSPDLFTGAMSLIVGLPNTAPIGGNQIDPVPWFAVPTGLDLDLNLSASTQVSGVVVYDYR